MWPDQTGRGEEPVMPELKPLHQPAQPLRWNLRQPEDEEPQTETAGPRRGDDAVLHTPDTRGRRSVRYPDVNITKTARALEITKSHLGKILAGDNRPSLVLAEKLADALGVSISDVIALYRNKRPRGRKGKA